MPLSSTADSTKVSGGVPPVSCKGTIQKRRGMRCKSRKRWLETWKVGGGDNGLRRKRGLHGYTGAGSDNLMNRAKREAVKAQCKGHANPAHAGKWYDHNRNAVVHSEIATHTEMEPRYWEENVQGKAQQMLCCAYTHIPHQQAAYGLW